MPSLLTRFNFGASLKDNPDLNRQLDQIYTTIAQIVNGKVSKLILAASDPPANDQVNKNFEIGDIAVRMDNNKAWIMTSRTSDLIVNWQLIT